MMNQDSFNPYSDSAPSSDPSAEPHSEPGPAFEPSESAEAIQPAPAESPAAAAEDAPLAAAAPPALHIAVSALSDMGCVRKNNEDSYGYDGAAGIYVVCDGMGGMASGEVASARAVAALVDTFAASVSTGASISGRLLHAIKSANLDVWNYAQIPEHKGMGTTLVAAARDEDRLILGNVGDSRAYMIQGGQCIQLTVDHSYINELIRTGVLTIEEAPNADLRGMESVITRAVGVGAEVEPDFFSVDLKPGTAILLASDGLTRYVNQDEIAAFFAATPFEAVCQRLIDCAKQRGGVDNITCILLQAVAA